MGEKQESENIIYGSDLNYELNALTEFTLSIDISKTPMIHRIYQFIRLIVTGKATFRL